MKQKTIETTIIMGAVAGAAGLAFGYAAKKFKKNHHDESVSEPENFEEENKEDLELDTDEETDDTESEEKKEPEDTDQDDEETDSSDQ